MSVFTRRVSLDAVFDKLPVPLVLLNRYTGENQFPAVVPDEETGGRMGTLSLIKKGHKRIATIVGESFMEAAQDRLTGYRQALAEAGLRYDDSLVAEGNWTPTSGFDATRKLLSLSDPPTAIFCQNDKMAMGCFMAIGEAGLRIPQDISVIGYDDDELSRHLRPQLTTLELPHRPMGAWAIEHLARKPGARRAGLHKVACTIVSRGSIGREPA